MHLVTPSVSLEHITPDALRVIERFARTCYRSEGRITDDSAEPFVRGLLKRGHLSMLEAADAVLRLTCDLGVARELTRHRLATFAQESTRYVRVNDLGVIEPPGLEGQDLLEWDRCVQRAERGYLALVSNGVRPEIARSVLPLCTATEVVCKANFREWLHILSLRTAPAAHPQMRTLMGEAQRLLAEACPVVFGGVQ